MMIALLSALGLTIVIVGLLLRWYFRNIRR